MEPKDMEIMGSSKLHSRLTLRLSLDSPGHSEIDLDSLPSDLALALKCFDGDGACVKGLPPLARRMVLLLLLWGCHLLHRFLESLQLTYFNRQRFSYADGDC